MAYYENIMQREFINPDAGGRIRPTGFNRREVTEAVALEQGYPSPDKMDPDVVQVGLEIHGDLKDDVFFYFYMLRKETNKLPAGITYVRADIKQNSTTPPWLDTLLSEVSDLTFYNPSKAKSWLRMRADELAGSKRI